MKITTDEECLAAKQKINRMSRSLRHNITAYTGPHPEYQAWAVSSVGDEIQELMWGIEAYERGKQVQQYPPYMPWLWWGEEIA